MRTCEALSTRYTPPEQFQRSPSMPMRVFAAALAALLAAHGSTADPLAVVPVPRAPPAGSTPPTTPPLSSSAELIESLGLRAAPEPVRARAGWHRPRLILISPNLRDLLPRLREAVPGVKLIELSGATPKEIAAADATIGICTPQVLATAKHLQWIQWPAAGVE